MRTRPSLPALAGLISAAAVTGCATVPDDAGFPEVQQTVRDRTGQDVHWRRGGDADGQAEQKIDQLLAEPLSPESAAQVALLNNRRLQATYERLMLAQADLVEAGLLSNPIFEAELISFDEGTSVELSVVQDFLDVLQVPLRKRLAGAELAATKRDVAAQVIDTARQVRQATVELVAANQRLEMRRTVLDAMQLSYELAVKLRDAGNLTDLDLAMERASFEQARLDVAQTEARQITLRERLTVLLGLWGPRAESWSVIARLPEPAENPDTDAELSAAGLLGRAIDHSLALDAARYRLAALADRLGLSEDYRLLGELEAGIKAEREPGESKWHFGPVLSLPIPIFDAGQAEIARASAELREAEADYYAQAVEVRGAVRSGHARLESTRSQADFYRSVMLPLRQEVVDLTQRQYNAMQVGAFELLQAKRQQVETASDYLDALTAYWNAHTDLQAMLDGGSASLEVSEAAPASAGSTMTAGDGH